MNPIASAALGSILRWGLAILAGYLVKAGIWESTEAVGYVTAGSLGLLALGLSLWNKYKGRVTFLTGLSMPKGTTEEDVHDHIKGGGAVPAIMTPIDVAPVRTL